MNTPTKITPLLAEETGWHIGDGSMNFYKNKGIYQLRGHLIDDKNHYKNVIKPTFKELYNLDVSLRSMESTGVYGFQIWSDKLVQFKNKIGLPLGKKTNIKIPEILIQNKLTIPTIRGIFDTDGCLYLEKKNNKPYPRIKINTTSKRLAEQLKKQIIGLGIRATKYTYKRKEENWNDLNSIEVRGINETNKWFKIIKPKNKKFIDKYNFLISQNS